MVHTAYKADPMNVKNALKYFKGLYFIGLNHNKVIDYFFNEAIKKQNNNNNNNNDNNNNSDKNLSLIVWFFFIHNFKKVF